ncbi:rho GTPase-activating protein 21-B isoform X4 [Atheta coriaria]|uniref:rho GTPase-activating protein 21-B isoform X4 n=1 Tax=Dalotia coriaria TaxID=877792 RepID=UPI0031F4764B
MADDDGEAKKQDAFLQNKETYKRTQETQNEQRFPIRVPGIVEVPVGSRGPRSLYLRRNGDTFGFTLRHFIIYPPESLAETDGRHAAVGALLTPMDTIFVRYVAQGGPAEQAGLQRGDRILYVNGESVSTLTYSQVVHKIQTSPPYLHLLVVPKEEDVLQKYFSDTAHNPVSNQCQSFDEAEHRRKGFQVDSVSWRSLQDSGSNYGKLSQSARRSQIVQQQKSADNIYSSVNDFAPPYQRPVYQKSADNLYSSPSDNLRREVLVESNLNDLQRARAQPQVPLYRKMGRRSSECATTESLNCDELTLKANYGMDVQFANAPTPANCRMALDAHRRESSSSLGSSANDGSKDSLLSYDSTSTLTGHDTDDSVAMVRLKKSLQKKEEFLRRPSNPAVDMRVQKEFYSRPKKLDKPVWPPNDSPTRLAKPTHHIFQRVKNDIESERESLPNQDGSTTTTNVGKPTKTSKDWHFGQLGKIHEAPTHDAHVNGNSSDGDDRRNYPPHSLQIVSKRAKQFESGHVTPEDDPLSNADRTLLYRSELAGMAQKRVVPNVAVRTKEFETRIYEPHRDFSSSSIASSNAHLRKSFRDSRSLDSSGSNCSLGSSIAENVKQLPGNFSIPIGSKFIHCVPPADGQATQDIPNDVQLVKTRARSNSAGSWAQAMQDSKTDEKMDTTPISTRAQVAPSPLIPQPVERFRATPCVSVTPASPVPNGAVAETAPPHSVLHPSHKPHPARPTDLDLGAPKRPMRHLRPPQADAPPVPAADKHLVVRRTKNTNLTDEERGTRRESYLKATEGGRMHFESADLSDGDVSPQLLRRGSISGGSSSSTSLERDKHSPLVEKEKPQFVRERLLHLKITEIDGKRYPDRSWKQVWAVLKGPKLFLYKDRHHQSPVGTSEVADQSLANGVDMRGSCVQVADDYTKRKNVLRISSVLPCRSELLLQAESTEELAEWVQVLHEQVATDVDGKDVNSGKQQAVPQSVPAATSIQVQGGKSKLPTLRNRSPTGQSPVSKTRKPSQVNDPSTSPKSKTWRGRVAKQFRRIQHGASSPSSPTAPEGSTFGNNLEHCLPSEEHPYVPKLVEICTDFVENRGLEVIGIYRVPGNSAAVTALTDEVNKSYDEVSQVDPRWNDVHVVSSLLKSFFRRLPDSLLTTGAYPYFIQADNIEVPVTRLEEIRKLVKSLPVYNYHTLRHLILHLRRVADNSEVNKMDTKNLAIVFGPTIVRTGEENMQKMVNDMTHQCKIVESLLKYADWFFSDDSVESLNLPAAPIAQGEIFPTEMKTNTALLKENISKMEGLTQSKDQKDKLFLSIFTAAHKRYRKKPKDNDEPQSPTGTGQFNIVQFANATNDLKESTTEVKPSTNEPIKEEKVAKPRDSNAVFNYNKDTEMFRQRVENFIQETNSVLSRPRNNSNNSLDMPNHQMSSSSSSNVRHSLTVNNTCDQRVITKTNSASNVFGRSAPSAEKCAPAKPQFLSFGAKPDSLNNSVNKLKDSSSDISSNASDYKGLTMRRGSSVENIGNQDFVNANGKKVKYENENESNMQRTNSLDSLNKLPALDDGDLVTTMTKIYDERKKKLNPSILSDENIPYVDESPEKICRQSVSYLNKENIPSSPKLYRNPSLHKSQYTNSKLLSTCPNNTYKIKEKLEVAEKDEDCTIGVQIPDNDKVALTTSKKVNIMTSTGNSRLRRSESLNKPERTVSPLNNKLKRSESLNKANDRLKRSDSLTKNEKTESNISKKREISGTRRGKDVFKLKRKNGMPDRSIKRRHTVGGYPDKIILDNRSREEVADNENKKEKTLRTSSPDLSSTRRERLFLEVNFYDSENMILSLRQHLVGARPQSFPESVYKVPLESHV